MARFNLSRILAAALPLAVVIGCGAPQNATEAPAKPPEAGAASGPPQNAIVQVTPNPDAPFAIILGGGLSCHGDAGETFFNGNAKLCSVIRNDARIDPELGAPHRRVTIKMTYHQPGPVTAKGDVVGRNESDVRVDCETGEAWAMGGVTYGVDHAVILVEPTNPPAKFPGSPTDLVKLVCEKPL